MTLVPKRFKISNDGNHLFVSTSNGRLYRISNLQAVLKEAGCTPQQVVRTTVFLADLGDFTKVNALYAEVFGQGVSPARACVEVAALPKGARVEIDCIAVLG